MLEGYGSFGAVFSTPRLRYIKKYKFIIESYKFKHFNLENHLLDEIESKEDKFLNIEVSKIFFETIEYREEVIAYLNIINKYNVNSKYFNHPLNFGTFNDELKINEKKYDNFKNIYYQSNNQITFLKGTKILLSKLDDIIINFKNIFEGVKYLNENYFLFDDIKYDNILNFDGIYKFSDFSSLIKFRKNSSKIYKESKLPFIFYHIYNPIYNNIIYLIFTKKTELMNFIEFSIHRLFKKLREDDDFIKNYNYTKKLLEKFIKIVEKLYVKNDSINIQIKCIDMNNIECNVEISLFDIIENIFFFMENNIHSLKMRFYKKTEYLLYYYILKYDKSIELIKEEIFRKINIYSIGISLLHILGEKIESKAEAFSSNYDLKLFLEIIILCLLGIFEIDDKFYYNNIEINDLYKKYSYFFAN